MGFVVLRMVVVPLSLVVLRMVVVAMVLLEVEVSYAHHLIRVLLSELARIENHLLNIACHAGDLGCLSALLSVSQHVVLSASS